MQEFGQANQPQRVMTDEEAQAVLRLHMSQPTSGVQISTTDVAEAIQMPENHVEALLAQVRAQNQEAAIVKPAKRQKMRDVILAVIAALILLFVGINAARGLHRTIVTKDVWSYQPATFQIDAGAIHKTIDTHIAPVDANQEDLQNVLWHNVESEIIPHNVAEPKSIDIQTTIAELKARNWDIPGILHQQFSLSAGPASYQSSFPYSGIHDPKVQALLAEERYTRLMEALRQISEQARVASP